MIFFVNKVAIRVQRGGVDLVVAVRLADGGLYGHTVLGTRAQEPVTSHGHR